MVVLTTCEYITIFIGSLAAGFFAGWLAFGTKEETEVQKNWSVKQIKTYFLTMAFLYPGEIQYRHSKTENNRKGVLKMSKKEICLENQSFAYYSGFGGLEFKKIEYGIEDYIYCVSAAWTGKPNYHKLKVYTDRNGDLYLKLHGWKVPLNDCIRI